jgi:RNA polymerase sigma-70 factor (ECF subfamily)
MLLNVLSLNAALTRDLEQLCLPGPFFRLGRRAEAEDARLRALMQEHFNFVWRSLRRLGLSESDADDGAQEVFLVLSRKLSAVRTGSERKFLFATALRIASTRRRSLRRRREEPTAELDEHDQGSAPGPERMAELSRARETLSELLADMDIELRAPFVLFELEELSAPEIAQLLDLPLGTVASRLRAAREHFHAALRRLQARQTFGGRPP